MRILPLILWLFGGRTGYQFVQQQNGLNDRTSQSYCDVWPRGVAQLAKQVEKVLSKLRLAGFSLEQNKPPTKTNT